MSEIEKFAALALVVGLPVMLLGVVWFCATLFAWGVSNDEAKRSRLSQSVDSAGFFCAVTAYAVLAATATIVAGFVLRM